MSEPRFEVVSPVGRWAGQAVRPAPGGRRVGFVWDHVFRGDEIFRVAEEGLRALDGGLSFVGWPAFGDIHGPDERRVIGGLGDRLRAEEVDAAIVGVGA